jgi:DNA-binding transcriptional MerR regulator
MYVNITPGQLREALQLSQDAYRHWKTVLGPLTERKGRRACFTHNDLLALALIKSLTDKIGIPVGNLGPLACTLFEACDQQSWARLERFVILIFPDGWGLEFASETQPAPLGRLMISMPCKPIIENLRAALMIEQIEENQLALRFPLAAVAAERGARNS